MRYAWSRLNRHQKGTYGEFLAKMEFVMYGFLVFSAEIDDRGVDFVVRNDDGRHFDVQVKTVSGRNYTWIKESKFNPRLWVCLVTLEEGMQPSLYLFSGGDWATETDGLLQKNHFPKGKEAEFGIFMSKGRSEQLARFAFDAAVERLRGA